MSTLGAMIDRIRTDLNRGPEHDTRIRQAIADAIIFYEGERFGFNTKRAQAVLTSSNEYVALPTDWIEVDYLRMDMVNERDPLDEVTYDWIDDYNRDGNDRGRPERFAIHNRELRFYPIPDQTYTLVMSFHCELPQVSASASDGATNAWMTEAEQLIRKHAMSDLLVTYIGGEESTAQGLLLRQECSDRIAPALERRAAREQSSGKIRAWL